MVTSVVFETVPLNFLRVIFGCDVHSVVDSHFYKTQPASQTTTGGFSRSLGESGCNPYVRGTGFCKSRTYLKYVRKRTEIPGREGKESCV